MFICEKCVTERYVEGFPQHSVSYGTCEICEKGGYCVDNHGYLTLKGNPAVTETMRQIVSEQLKIVHKILPDEKTDIYDNVDEYLVCIGRYTARVVRDKDTGSVEWEIDAEDGDEVFQDIHDLSINNVRYAIETIIGMIGKDNAQQHLRSVNETVGILEDIHLTATIKLHDAINELKDFNYNNGNALTKMQKDVIDGIRKRVEDAKQHVENELKNYRESIK